MGYSNDGMWGCGERPQKGDVVRCVANCYMSIKRDETRVVFSVRDGNIELENSKRTTPYGTSFYKASSFELVERRTPPYQIQPQEKKMTQYLHLALLTDGEGFSWSELADQINENVLPVKYMAGTSLEELKARIKIRIENNPDELWVILGGMGTASGKRRPAVDVKFTHLA